MEYRKLGRSGLDVSVIGLGGNMFGWGCDRAQSADVIAAARDAGINTIDQVCLGDESAVAYARCATTASVNLTRKSR